MDFESIFFSTLSCCACLFICAAARPQFTYETQAAVTFGFLDEHDDDDDAVDTFKFGGPINTQLRFLFFLCHVALRQFFLMKKKQQQTELSKHPLSRQRRLSLLWKSQSLPLLLLLPLQLSRLLNLLLLMTLLECRLSLRSNSSNNNSNSTLRV